MWTVRFKQKDEVGLRRKVCAIGGKINIDEGNIKKPRGSLLSCNPNKKYKKGLKIVIQHDLMAILLDNTDY